MKNVIAKVAQYTSPLIVNKTYYPITILDDGLSFEVTNRGTAAAPCRLSFTPINDIMLLTIEGLSDEPLVMENILRNSKVVLDGLNNKILINGEDHFEAFKGWEFPKIQPGKNTIKMTAANQMALIEIEFQPRYI